MKVFQSIQADCALLAPDSYKLREKHKPNVLSLIVFSSYILSTASSGYYLCSIDKSFEQYITSFYVATSILVCLLQFINLFWQMPELTDFFLNIEDIIQHRQNYPESKDIYDKSLRLAELCYQIISTLFVKILVVAFMLPPYFACFYAYYFAIYSSDDAFVLPYFMWFPFDWKNPIGYTAAYGIECAMGGQEFLLSSCLACLGVVAFLLGMAMTKDLRNILFTIQKNNKAKRNRSHGVKKLYQFIEFHSIPKQSICNFTDIFQPVTVILFLWSIGSLCVAFILLEMGINENRPFWLAVAILQIEWSIGLASLPCELGQRFTNAFDAVDEMLTELSWYVFPIEIKKMLPMIMMNTQETVALKCFGSILCGREVFRKVLNSAFSYFMVLRQFSD